MSRRSIFDGAMMQRIRRGSAMVLGGGTRRRSKLPSKKSRVATTVTTITEEVDRQTLHDRLKKKLFCSNLPDKFYSDIIRTGHLVTIETKVDEGNEDRFTARDAVSEEEFPDRKKREMQRMIMIIELLIKYFAEDEEADDIEELTEYLYTFSEMYDREMITAEEFNLATLFDKLEELHTEDEQVKVISQTKRMLGFLHISVISFAIEELREKLKLGIKHLTKDMEGGWEVTLKLDKRFIEICHVRRESVLKPSGPENYWEIAYNVTMIFDPAMEKFNACRLGLTNLHLAEGMDPALADDLKVKFFGGKFIVC